MRLMDNIYRYLANLFCKKQKRFYDLLLQKIRQENKDLIKELKIISNYNYLEDYLNNKYPIVDIRYAGRYVPTKKEKFIMDVRNFLWCRDSLIKEIVEKNRLKKESYDETALACLKWVRRNIKYIPDKVNVGYTEFWQFPNETIQIKGGDCEDGAILLASLMMNAGIPYWRIRVNCGLVGRRIKRGHAYVSYCRESDNKFVVLDWCYFYNAQPIDKRRTHRQEALYTSVWFSFNKKYSFRKPVYEIDYEDKIAKDLVIKCST